jgi:hypothetical protein
MPKRRSMTVTEFLAWAPTEDQCGTSWLNLRVLPENETAATTPEDLRTRWRRRPAVTAAEQLHAYLSWRAERVGVARTLTVGFYLEALDRGCTDFFGVRVGGGYHLVADREQPELFREWQRPN